MLRFDLYFSYWIFIWFVICIVIGLHIFPFYSLCIALIYHLCMFIYTLNINKDKIEKTFIIGNIIVLSIIKLFPIIYIIQYNYDKIRFLDELLILTILITIYTLWKYQVNQNSLVKEYDYIIHNGLSENTPVVSLLKKIM